MLQYDEETSYNLINDFIENKGNKHFCFIIDNFDISNIKSK